MTDTMRRVRNYKQATEQRKSSRFFQERMLVHLISIQSRRLRVQRTDTNKDI